MTQKINKKIKDKPCAEQEPRSAHGCTVNKFRLSANAAVPENTDTYPCKVTGNSLGMGVSEAKIVKLKYEAKLEIPGGWGGVFEVKHLL